MKCIVTGGCGFIGSHLVDALVSRGDEVIVVDNLVSGNTKTIEKHIKKKNFSFVKEDILNKNKMMNITKNADFLWHIAANPDVKGSANDPDTHMKQTIEATKIVLDCVVKNKVKGIAFTSTSTVYGEANELPTKESYGPCMPISIYGAAKLAAEALICAYARTYGFNAAIFRFANVVGSRSNHGVIFDFAKKLKKNKKELEILGDGTQTKSYFYVSDCIRGMLFGVEKKKKPVEIYNIGSSDAITVTELAETVTSTLGLTGVMFKYTGGISGGAGWVGDVKNMELSTDKLKKTGWKPKYTSKESVVKTVQSII